METFPLWCGRFAVTAFFAIAFLQSAADKVVDSKGNLEYLTGHFASSPLCGLVQPMFWAITVLEAVAGMGLGASALGADICDHRTAVPVLWTTPGEGLRWCRGDRRLLCGGNPGPDPVGDEEYTMIAHA